MHVSALLCMILIKRASGIASNYCRTILPSAQLVARGYGCVEDLHTNSTEEPEVGQVCDTSSCIQLKHLVLQGSYLQANQHYKECTITRLFHTVYIHKLCTHAHTQRHTKTYMNTYIH